MPMVYNELKRIARTKLKSERANHTLSPTALVQEAWLKLRDVGSAAFFGVSGARYAPDFGELRAVGQCATNTNKSARERKDRLRSSAANDLEK